MAYEINYDDQRFKDVETDKKNAISEVEKTYSGMIDDAQSYYDEQIQASKDWADKQTQIQNEQTEFAIDKIEQQKAQEKKDYLREQSGAYVDWKKQSNQYGAEAEQQAAAGLAGSGFSESSQVSMYNTYQNRVTAARESYNLAVQNYNNAITEARLQNNSALAEIAYQALQTQLELSLQGFQYKNQLVLEMADKKTQVENEYYSRYQDVLAQINHENALAEEIRQYNETLEEQKRQHNESLAEEKRQYNATLALQQAQLAEEKRQFNASLAASQKKSYSGGGGSSTGGTINKTSSGSNSSKANAAGPGINKNQKPSLPKQKQPTVDMQSVLALGYGPISTSRLNQLIKDGIVTEYEQNGKLKYKKTIKHGGKGGKF